MLHLVVPGWARPRQMIGKEATELKLYGTTGEPCLFKHVSPRDIQQGYLGDCWLVSSFSALAEYPDRVRSLFKQKSLSADGRYDIRLYCPHEEEWKVITIDDRLPYWQRPGQYGNLCFAKQSTENEFWPCLLEKAVAKLVGAYYRIDGGFESIALEMLTGKPAINIGISEAGTHQPYGILTGPDEKQVTHASVYLRKTGFDAHWGYWGQDASKFCNNKTDLSDADLWSTLKSWDKEGYSIACGSRGNYQATTVSVVNEGIIAGHAYTMLRTVEVQVLRQGKSLKFQMLHVRNPHMTNEWKGKWYDDDRETWNKYPEVMKACDHKVGVKDNGVFWMEWADFKKGFAELAVCFDNQQEGPRYTDQSEQAQEDHAHVSFGRTGHQRWEGL
ncbi:Calpain-type cysteine protease ADL1 (Phytocalpain ADL1) (Protein ADAXIALIZED LEAF1) (Protein DEFECTIVE KERNEL 1) (OsDEK1) (Protein SHOOTLESS 3) [Durusdinium trenchii]|uniref:Calpain-type cysteine protease ADL1 (Phytocalpain ADL1) (Protein ADAXIALIZED LEAF1) (Protein DEFECTIVE KERNEL 1) (OsDEK1) (Protein SHOOTLESS 3) n=1 Tax=Durusdinium trenchii TaxID=1381693 RepID=A0ABP0PR75_9DINO